MKRRIFAAWSPVLAAVVALAFASAWLPGEAKAGMVEFTASITRAQETPACGAGSASAVGSGTFTLDAVANTLSYNITFSGLSSAELKAHFHSPASPGMTAGIRYNLPNGSPKVGVITLSDPPDVGGAYTIAAQKADLINGLWYVNIHSSNCGGGEIRGQLVRSVGGISELPGVDGNSSRLQSTDSGTSMGMVAALAAGLAALVVVFSGVAWVVRRRLVE